MGDDVPFTDIVIVFESFVPIPLSASQVYAPFKVMSIRFITKEPDGEILMFEDWSWLIAPFFPSSIIAKEYLLEQIYACNIMRIIKNINLDSHCKKL